MEKKIERVLMLAVFVLVALGLYFARTDAFYFEDVYTREDNFIEWGTVTALAFGLVLCIYRIIHLWNVRHKFFLFCTLVLACLFFFGMGEEISWGQRIFDLKSSAFFVANNTQQETNFHNLMIGGVRVNKLLFGLIGGLVIGIYFFVLPFAYNRVQWVRKWSENFALPIPRYFHIAFLFLLLGMSYLTFSGKKGELFEFSTCWTFVLMTWRPYNKNIFKA